MTHSPNAQGSSAEAHSFNSELKGHTTTYHLMIVSPLSGKDLFQHSTDQILAQPSALHAFHSMLAQIKAKSEFLESCVLS